MAELEHVYVVIVTSWKDPGPLRGIYVDAWDAIRAVRGAFPGSLYESPVPDMQLAEGVVFLADVSGESDTHVMVRRTSVVPSS